MKNHLSPATVVRQSARWCGSALASLLLAGCVEYPARPVGYGPPPPPIQEAVIGVAPGPGYVWIPGHWVWRHRHYIWFHGYWAYAPRPGAAWIEGHWENRGGSYVYVDGYWR